MELSRVVDEPHGPYTHVLSLLSYNVKYAVCKSYDPAQGIETAVNLVF